MNKFTHKELGLIMAFESVDTEHDIACWMKDVERLLGIRAALIMREVLLNKISPPSIHQQELEDLEGEYKEKLEDIKEQLADLEERAEKGWPA